MTDTTKNTLDSTQNIKHDCNDAFISKIEPGQNIIGNTTAGPQQFTILADTRHGDPLITNAILDAIPSMAQSGVKHLMHEFVPYPTHQNILNKLYQDPPQITEEEIRENAYLFESTYGTPEEQKQNSLIYAEIIIQAHKNGIKLHLAGDKLGYDELGQMSWIYKKRNQLINQSPLLQKYLDTAINSTLEEIIPAFDALKKHEPDLLGQYTKLEDKWLETQKIYKEKRMGFKAEESRAERFITLANGEKSVIVFGQGHVDSKSDINEIIDQKLREQALENESTERLVKTKVIELYPFEAYREDVYNLGNTTDSPDVQYFAKEHSAITCLKSP